jgi:nitroalkane oxidase
MRTGEIAAGFIAAIALALPLFGGGNIGVQRRQLHAILKRLEYDPLAASSEVEV